MIIEMVKDVPVSWSKYIVFKSLLVERHSSSVLAPCFSSPQRLLCIQPAARKTGEDDNALPIALHSFLFV